MAEAALRSTEVTLSPIATSATSETLSIEQLSQERREPVRLVFDADKASLRVAAFGDTARTLSSVPPPTQRIERSVGVCGGEARVAGTRIPVWVLERFGQLGTTTEQLLSYYPSLTRAALDAALSYARQNPDEIAAAILRNEAP